MSGKSNKLEMGDFKRVRMLSEDVSASVERFRMLERMGETGCVLTVEDHGMRGMETPVIAEAPFSRSRVFTGSRAHGAFNHHAAIAKFRGRYYVAWSNGIRNEEDERQRTLISWSDDAVDWSAPVCVCGNEDGIAHNCMGLLAEDDRLVLLNMKESIEHDATLPGMRRIEPGSKELSAMVSSDGTSWETAFTYGDHMKMFLEAPRLTADGALLCVAVTNQGPVMLRWASDDVCQEPESILIPEPRGTSFPYGEGTWYQVDDGTIMVFWRDEGMSCRVWVNYSDDGGRTFSEPVVSDIPDSMSRLYAGRLADGRYYLCNNASATLLNRRNLMLMISETGYEFTSVHMLANDPTSQRFFGLLKEDGYQYPCCLAEEGRLLVAYSVNKEDIECGILYVSRI